ncbi:MoaD/ThiS family protein [bacterium]|nr:MoaD/ThiS family protein [bacterium]
MENKFRYYGQIQDLTGKAEETINHKFKTIGGLRAFIIERYPKLGNINFKIAQNNSIDKDSSPINGTLIDFLPPFSGG